MKHHLLLAFVFVSSFSIAQTRVENPLSSSRSAGSDAVVVYDLPTNIDSAIAAIMIGGCVEISNFEVRGPSTAFGVFVDAEQGTGMTAGVILTTGDATIAQGPDDDNNAGVNLSISGQADLSLLAGASTFDATWIEFDFTPLADTLFATDFVFGSEEYPEYVNQGFNDVFAFFISGPGISGPFSNGAENIAWIPGTTTPVAIDNVNNGYSAAEPAVGPCTNCQYYVDNSSGPYLQYDGYTNMISLEYPVQQGETYHFMIAIADAGDGIYDSGVLIQSESFCGNTWFQYAEFVAQPQGGYMYDFINTSQQADTYIWEFGDGSVSIDENPSHTYDQPGEYEVTLTCTNACFDTSITVMLNVGMITGIEEQVEIGATVSNIGSDAISVKAELNRSATIQLSILDMLGRNFYTENVGVTSKFSKNVDISSLNKGVYLMRIEAGRSSSVVRFVKM